MTPCEETDAETTKTAASAVVSSVCSVTGQNLVDLPALPASGQQDPIIQALDDGAVAGLDYNVHAYTLENAQRYPMLDETDKSTVS